MNKKIIIGAVLASVFLFVGCGGGGSTPVTPRVDNSVLADGSTSLGYYGSRVIFGDFTVARKWTLSNPSYAEDILLIFSTGDGGYRVEGLEIANFDFGVSKDGTYIDINEGGDHFRVKIVTPVSEFCYDATLTNTDTQQSVSATICAEH